MSVSAVLRSQVFGASGRALVCAAALLLLLRTGPDLVSSLGSSKACCSPSSSTTKSSGETSPQSDLPSTEEATAVRADDIEIDLGRVRVVVRHTPVVETAVSAEERDEERGRDGPGSSTAMVVSDNIESGGE